MVPRRSHVYILQLIISELFQLQKHHLSGPFGILGYLAFPVGGWVGGKLKRALTGAA
jgi:hypothetical protein